MFWGKLSRTISSRKLGFSPHCRKSSLHGQKSCLSRDLWPSHNEQIRSQNLRRGFNSVALFTFVPKAQERRHWLPIFIDHFKKKLLFLSRLRIALFVILSWIFFQRDSTIEYILWRTSYLCQIPSNNPGIFFSMSNPWQRNGEVKWEEAPPQKILEFIFPAINSSCSLRPSFSSAQGCRTYTVPSPSSQTTTFSFIDRRVQSAKEERALILGTPQSDCQWRQQQRLQQQHYPPGRTFIRQ